MVGRVLLGRYEITRLLGEGGMGRVYLARQLDLGRQVVVKVMHEHIAADPVFRERFTRETLLMARFTHPYAVTLFDASVNDPQGSCIVMEYIKGVTLDNLLHTNGRLSPLRVGRLLGQLCEVLQAAHVAGIVHRDLKPANLMIVDPDTPYEMVKVMDFGLAKLLTPELMNKVTATTTEFAVGTPGYMCPEQARGEDMDHRGDLYSVGVILFELLTGKLPFSGGSTMDVLLAHATEEPPAFASVGASDWVPPALEEVVLACLAKDPADRPTNARALAERYEAALVTSQERTELPASLSGSSRFLMRPLPVPKPPENQATQASPTVHTPPVDPAAVVHQLEAWMPETIATFKMRGFIHDKGGEVLESVPGRIRVRLGGKGCVYVPPARGSLAWLGLGRKNQIDMELRLERVAGRENRLRITVVLRPHSGDASSDPALHELCTQIFCDLRAYLMGQTGAVSEAAG